MTYHMILIPFHVSALRKKMYHTRLITAGKFNMVNRCTFHFEIVTKISKWFIPRIHYLFVAHFFQYVKSNKIFINTNVVKT